MTVEQEQRKRVGQAGRTGLLDVIGLVLAAAYFIAGILWADVHREQRPNMNGLDNAIAYGSQVFLWPAHAVGLLPL